MNSTRGFHDLHEAFQEMHYLVADVGVGQFALLWSDQEEQWLLSFPTGPKNIEETDEPTNGP